METFDHQFTELFQQLGLPSDAAGIAQFIAQNSPLPTDVVLTKAHFWTKSQADFLCEAMRSDADWSAAVDALNTALRHARE
jgi:hypothetical protein